MDIKILTIYLVLQIIQLVISANIPGPNLDASSGTVVREKRNKAKAGCRNIYHIQKKTPITFTQKDAGKDGCEWDFIGDSNCNIELNCKGVTLKKSDDCADEYLKVSDGYGGEHNGCDQADFAKPLLASTGARDLFVEYLGSGTFSCTASCSATNDGKRLAQTVERKEESRCVCGLQNKDDRIVGGEDAKLNEFPWQAALVFAGTRSPTCGASVINDRYILTAAHCFYFSETKADEIEVLIHANVLDMTKQDNAADVALGQEGSIRGSGWNAKAVTDKEEHSQRFKVAEIIINDLFTEQYDFDYALLRLEKKIDLSAADAPTPICLPANNLWTESFEGKIPWVVGWGKSDENAGGTTRNLQKLDVPMINFKKCQGFLPGLVTSRMICAGYEEGKKDACTGDSGGPLILKQANKQWWQIGIVSWGEGCAQKHKPGLYSRVTEMSQWINFQASKNGAKWCKNTK